MRLIDHARAQLQRVFRAPWRRSPARLATATAPEAVTLSAAQPARGRVALLTGCTRSVSLPCTNAATARLLSRMGYDVMVARGVDCCGAVIAPEGRPAVARAAIEGWSRQSEGGGLDAIVINDAACGMAVKDYGFMFRDEPEPFRSCAALVSALAVDVTEWLQRATYTTMRPPPGLRVAYHGEGGPLAGRRAADAANALLLAAGFAVVEPAEAPLGDGPADGRDRKRAGRDMGRQSPDLIAVGQIGGPTRMPDGGVPMIHIVELLDWMAGGPEPRGLPASGSIGAAA